jgi:hypothetical protein
MQEAHSACLARPGALGPHHFPELLEHAQAHRRAPARARRPARRDIAP